MAPSLSSCDYLMLCHVTEQRRTSDRSCAGEPRCVDSWGLNVMAVGFLRRPDAHRARRARDTMPVIVVEHSHQASGANHQGLCTRRS